MTVGQSVVLNAAVAASSGSAVPTGTVTFLDGMTSLGVVSLDAQGLVSLPVAAFPLGAHTITAVYAGDSNFKWIDVQRGDGDGEPASGELDDHADGDTHLGDGWVFSWAGGHGGWCLREHGADRERDVPGREHIDWDGHA